MICRDELLKAVKIFLTVKTNFWIFLVKIFKIKTFSFKTNHVPYFSRFVKTNWDLLRNLNLMKTFWVWKWWKVSTFCKILRRNMQKSTYFSIDWDWDELSRNNTITKSRPTSQSWSRLLGLDIDVETKSRVLYLDQDLLTVETNFFFWGGEGVKFFW